MKQFLIAILCCFSLWSVALAADDDVKSFSYESTLGQIGAVATAAKPPQTQPSGQNLTILLSDSGRNMSDMDLLLYSAVAAYGFDGVKIGEVVKFSTPTPEWVLRSLLIMGWTGFNKTSGLFPANNNFLIEVRDGYGDLLYKFADTQNFYFASTEGPVLYKMDIPPLPVPKEFYVVFYDRGSMFLGAENGNGTGNSYLIINGQLVPAETTMKETNETKPVNWLIRAIGE